MNFLFVSGAHKSGTTWLAKMLGDHPQIQFSPNELWLFGHPNSISNTVRKSAKEWLTLPGVGRRFSDAESKEKIVKKITRSALRAALTGAVSAPESAAIIGDKSPYFYAISVQEITDTFAQSYYLNMLRDPRDVIVSHHYQAYRQQSWAAFGDLAKAKRVADAIHNGQDVGPDLLDEKKLAHTATRWHECQIGAQLARRLFKNRFLECRYEEMLQDASAQMRPVFRALNVDATPALVAKIVTQNRFENLSNGRKPGDANPRSFYRKGVAGDWENYFTKQTLQRVQEICGVQAQACGYGDMASPT